LHFKKWIVQALITVRCIGIANHLCKPVVGSFCQRGN
jgi:hypothetical protein